LAYLAITLAGWPALDGKFSPDTSSYLDFSPYRQPMYGLWAHAIFTLVGSYRAVELVQSALFIAAGMWVIFELSLISGGWGPLAAAIFAAALAVLNRLGLVGLAGSLNSEGLVYPMILLMFALFLVLLQLPR